MYSKKCEKQCEEILAPYNDQYWDYKR